MKTLEKNQLIPRRLTLKGWAAMEDLKKNIDSEAEEGNWSSIPELIFEIIELTSGEIDRDLFWIDVADLYRRSFDVNQPTKKFPMLTSKEEGRKAPWEYKGRSWYFWLNTFAKNYSWEPEKIASLEIDDAIGLYQEISIEDQLEKEWDWGLSEFSYEYNPSTKIGHFKPLPRPDWMLGIVEKQKPVKKVKMLKSMVPQGNIISLDGT